MNRRQLDVVADNLYTLANEIARHRGGSGPHWLMLSQVESAMQRHGIEISGEDLQAAVSIAVARCVLKTEGAPVHSIAPWQRDWQIDRPSAQPASA